MIVVVIVGILASVGLTALRRYVFSSKTVEAVGVVQSLGAAQMRWRAETQSYLDVSATLERWYPNKTPDTSKRNWDNPQGFDYANWRLLSPEVPGPVQFGYSVRAGAAGTALPVPSTSGKPSLGTPNEPWWMVQAMADSDGDGLRAYFVATSFNAEVYSENAGE